MLMETLWHVCYEKFEHDWVVDRNNENVNKAKQ